ncbi:MAG: hypothetical protein MNSN_10840 [Minisyncoccus archaeiphilus]|uniref:hypothetical protein n=1 Tax=Minisyncoccus archaeiphilus TaxID=3238481 RepID=UPI002B114D82|nr:MAG: hypothetical protein MNSN_10840 [Candidatus Parcubacteria bacterium]
MEKKNTSKGLMENIVSWFDKFMVVIGVIVFSLLMVMLARFSVEGDLGVWGGIIPAYAFFLFLVSSLGLLAVYYVTRWKFIKGLMRLTIILLLVFIAFNYLDRQPLVNKIFSCMSLVVMETSFLLASLSGKITLWKNKAFDIFIAILLFSLTIGTVVYGQGLIFKYFDINSSSPSTSIDKPVIYLYPTHEEDIVVNLDYEGSIIASYPHYNGQWSVKAYPDGRIIDISTNKEYSYLFWEGKPFEDISWDMSKGFVVRGDDVRLFLQDKLSFMGLTPKEYNEFIVYWYPRMKDNEYNLIHFAGREYIDTAKLSISPEPDSVLRVFMVFKPLDKKIDIEEQALVPFQRKGFSAVEWGGTEIK